MQSLPVYFFSPCVCICVVRLKLNEEERECAEALQHMDRELASRNTFFIRENVHLKNGM